MSDYPDCCPCCCDCAFYYEPDCDENCPFPARDPECAWYLEESELE